MPRRPRAAAAVAAAFAAVLTSAGGCITTPKAEAIRQQQMIDIGDALNDMRITLATMEATLDSLRIVVTKQDTTIARLANVTGVVVVK